MVLKPLYEALRAHVLAAALCLNNSAAERAMRGIALGRKAWLFVGSDVEASAPPSSTA